MIKRLEQVAALVVAAGLAIVSYWLFFSWAQGGGSDQRQRRSSPSSRLPLESSRSEAAAGLEQPLLAGAVVKGGHMGAHLLPGDRQLKGLAEGHDPIQRS
jgi:hypothetical protein